MTALGVYPSVIDNLTPEPGSSTDDSDLIFMPFRVMTLGKLLVNALSGTRPYAQFYAVVAQTGVYQVITQTGDTWLSTGDVFTLFRDGSTAIAQVIMSSTRVLLVHESAADQIISNQSGTLTVNANNFINNDSTQSVVQWAVVDTGSSSPTGSGTALGGVISTNGGAPNIGGNIMVSSPSTSAVYATVQTQFLAQFPNYSVSDTTRYDNNNDNPIRGPDGNFDYDINIARSTPFANAHFATYDDVHSVGNFYYVAGFPIPGNGVPNVSSALPFWDILPTQAAAACCANNIGTLPNFNAYCANYVGSSAACANLMTGGTTSYCVGAVLATTDCMTYCDQSYSDCDKPINAYAATLSNEELLANPQLFGCHMNNADGTPNNYLVNFYRSLRALLPVEFAATIVLQAQCVYDPCSGGTALFTTAQKQHQATACQNYTICYQKTTVNVDGTIGGNVGVDQKEGCSFNGTGTAAADAAPPPPGSSGIDVATLAYIGGGAIAATVIVILVIRYFAFGRVTAAPATSQK